MRRLLRTGSARRSSAAPSLEQLEDRCTPAGLHLGSLAAGGLDAVNAALTSLLTVDFSSSNGQGGNGQGGNGQGGNGQGRALGHLHAAVASTPVLDVGVQTGGTSVDVQAGSADQVVSVAAGTATGGDPGGTVSVQTQVGASGAAAVAVEVSAAAVEVSPHTEEGASPVAAQLAVAVSAPTVSPAVSPRAEEIVNGQSTAPDHGAAVTPPVPAAPAVMGAPALPVAVAVHPDPLLVGAAVGLDVVAPLAGGVSANEAGAASTGTVVASPGAPTPGVSAPQLGGGDEKEAVLPEADPGGLVTEFRLVGDDPTAAQDQLFSLPDLLSGSGKWPLFWSLSPAIVATLAGAVWLGRRRRAAVEAAAGRKDTAEWFPETSEQPGEP
jgi:hypothetical protein